MAIDPCRLARAKQLAQENLGRSVVAVNPELSQEAAQKSAAAHTFGVKNTDGIPSEYIDRLRRDDMHLLLTVDKMADLGRSVDTDLCNPLTYRPMTGSTSGGAVNILKGINDLCLGTDGGGSVLAPALATNLTAFLGRGIGLCGPAGRSTDGLGFTAGIGVIGRCLAEVMAAVRVISERPLSSVPLQRTIRVAIPAKGSMTLPGGEDANTVLREFLKRMPPDIAGRIRWEEVFYRAPYDRTALLTQLCGLVREDSQRLYLSFEGPIDVFSADETIPRAFTGPAVDAVAGTCGKAFVKAANPGGFSAFALPSDRLASGFVLLCPPGEKMLPAACAVAEALEEVSPRPQMFCRYFLRREKYCAPLKLPSL